VTEFAATDDKRYSAFLFEVFTFLKGPLFDVCSVLLDFGLEFTVGVGRINAHMPDKKTFSWEICKDGDQVMTVTNLYRMGIIRQEVKGMFGAANKYAYSRLQSEATMFFLEVAKSLHWHTT
jgi:hypothetical protein